MITQVLESICFCVCLPIIVPIRATQLVKDVSSRKKSAWKNDVRPLPRRRRRLSTGYSQQTNVNCHLLNKLPLELRLQIYEYVLGGNLLHLIQIPRRIAHVRCRALHVPDHSRQCRPASRMPLHPWLRTISSANLALLKTCRQIYIEAIDILYTTNTFDINHLSTFISFSQTIRSQRLGAITSLHMYWDLGYNFVRYGSKKNYQDWNTFWHVVATQMPGLRDLDICLKRGFQLLPITPSHYEPWVSPMCEVRGLRSVEIEIGLGMHEEELSSEDLGKQDAVRKTLIMHIKNIMLSKER